MWRGNMNDASDWVERFLLRGKESNVEVVDSNLGRILPGHVCYSMSNYQELRERAYLAEALGDVESGTYLVSFSVLGELEDTEGPRPLDISYHSLVEVNDEALRGLMARLHDLEVTGRWLEHDGKTLVGLQSYPDPSGHNHKWRRPGMVNYLDLVSGERLGMILDLGGGMGALRSDDTIATLDDLNVGSYSGRLSKGERKALDEMDLGNHIFLRVGKLLWQVAPPKGSDIYESPTSFDFTDYHRLFSDCDPERRGWAVAKVKGDG